MKFSRRVFTLGLCVVGVTAASFGCSDDNAPSSPVSPSATPQLGSAPAAIGEIQTAIDLASLGTDTVNLKSTAATPASPINNEEVNSKRPPLTATNARGTYQDATFDHVFALYNVTGGGMTLVETGTVAQGTGSTSFHPTGDLDGNSSYQWRVRPVLNGFFGPWSAFASFTTPAFIIIGVPTATYPIDGITVANLLPDFHVENGTNEGETGEVIYQVQVATDSGFTTVVQEVGTHARSRGDTNIPLLSPLEPSTHYWWRVRGRNDGQGKTAFLPGATAPGVSTVVGNYSAAHDFFTPDQATGPTTAPGKGQCCPPINRLDIVLDVHAATGNLLNTNPTEFTRQAAQCMATIDGDYGIRRNDSGTIGKDTIAYRVGGSDNNPHSTDIAVGVTTPNPRLQWADHGRVGGSFIAVDGSKCILGAITAR